MSSIQLAAKPCVQTLGVSSVGAGRDNKGVNKQKSVLNPAKSDVKPGLKLKPILQLLLITSHSLLSPHPDLASVNTILFSLSERGHRGHEWGQRASSIVLKAKVYCCFEARYLRWIFDIIVLDCGQKEVCSGQVSLFSGGTRVSLLCFPCSQVPVLVQDQDLLQEGTSTPGTAVPHAPISSHIATEICQNPFTDAVMFNLQDPQHGTQ